MARETAAPPPPGPASELLSLRLHPRDLQVLSEAAALLQVSLSEFVVLAAYQQAKQVLADMRPASRGSPSRTDRC